MSVYGQLLMKAAQEGHQETVLQAADTVVRASLRINQLLNDLLTYTEVSNNPLENTVQHIDLNAALTMTLDNLRLLIDQSGANVSYPTLPTVTIQGREGMLVQVFQNLIENAIKYRRGVPQVSISAERKGADWQLAVSDNGSGIPPQFYEHIFGVFKRLHGKDIAGTGMGLAICKRAIERCGGRIWVESKIGQGSTFYFSLPAL
jgi:light-regulated signal transduction histidine kinase (bacteriophytochrome)